MVCEVLWQSLMVCNDVPVSDGLLQPVAVFEGLWSSVTVSGDPLRHVTVFDGMWHSVTVSDGLPGCRPYVDAYQLDPHANLAEDE